ncbi:MAG: hypothetical protein HFH41_05870 [Lachnospiraceae bacterium]|nr:hypothetical protein [Lachnospiraceae bacterium]
MVGAVGSAGSYNDYYGSYGAKGYESMGRSGDSSQGILSVDGSEEKNRDGSVKKIGERCQTCENRKYQDGSDENVSFKAAAHVSPEAAAGAVRAHEGEHVSNAYTKAAQKEGKVVSASVSIHTSVCPECGRTYVSGGTTNTKIKYPANPYEESRKVLGGEEAKGKNIDYAA